MNLENNIRAIMEQMKNLPQIDRDHIIEYLDHNEWGIAVEHLCSSIREEKILLSESLYEKIRQVSEQMEIWNDIREEIKDCKTR